MLLYTQLWRHGTKQYTLRACACISMISPEHDHESSPGPTRVDGDKTLGAHQKSLNQALIWTRKIDQGYGPLRFAARPVWFKGLMAQRGTVLSEAVKLARGLANQFTADNTCTLYNTRQAMHGVIIRGKITLVRHAQCGSRQIYRYFRTCTIIFHCCA